MLQKYRKVDEGENYIEFLYIGGTKKFGKLENMKERIMAKAVLWSARQHGLATVQCAKLVLGHIIRSGMLEWWRKPTRRV